MPFSFRFVSVVMAGALLSACATSSVSPPQAVTSRMKANQAGISSQVVRAEAVPAGLVKAILPQAQQVADDASKRRDIDYFNLHANPIGMRIGDAYVLSFLGTSKERTDLNIELRALYAPAELGFIYNYSGPVTLARGSSTTRALVSKSEGLRFELIDGLPGNGVSEAYGDFLDHLAGTLKQRYQARPFTFDDAPIIFAVMREGVPAAFLLTNQGNRLVLGDRKYADVQSVALFSSDAKLLNAYTLVGFNAKTSASTQPPVYQYQNLSGLGLVAQLGELD